jgi:hypothetical protein
MDREAQATPKVEPEFVDTFHMPLTGPVELKDFQFRDEVLPPTSSFAASLALRGGFKGLGMYPTEVEVDYIYNAIGQAYREFGGAPGALQFPVDVTAVEQYVYHDLNQYSFGDLITALTHKYLSGQGEDYDGFHARIS